MVLQVDVNALAQEAQRGGKSGKKSLEELVRVLSPTLIAFYQKKGGFEAEELAQRTWFRVIQKLDQYDSSRDFKAWFFAIAYYEWVGACKQKAKSPDSLLEDPVERCDSSEEADDERIHRLEECMSRLSPEERSIIYLRYWERMNLELIAEQVGKEYGSLKAVAYRIVVKLRKCMEIRELGKK